MTEKRLPVWNGEWGPVYARNQYEGEATDEINQARLHVLKDQLQIYDKVNDNTVRASNMLKEIFRHVLVGPSGFSRTSMAFKVNCV